MTRLTILVLAVAVAAISGCVSPSPATSKPQDRPYAAGSPSGGVPVWNQGEKFVGVAGGDCRGNCPIYELYVFDDGRVVFVGKKNTGRTGIFRKQVAPEAYA